MSDLPLPLPDRRTLGNNTNQQLNFNKNNKSTKEKSKIFDKQNNNNLTDSTEINSLTKKNCRHAPKNSQL